jgi:hypothetical protein
VGWGRWREGEGDGGVLEVVDIAPVDAVEAVWVVVDGADGGGGGGDGCEGRGGSVAVFVSSGAYVEVAVVVAADDYFVGVRQRLEPVDRGLDLAGATVIAEVACVDEQIAVRDVVPF